jgi:hypothetical protein
MAVRIENYFQTFTTDAHGQIQLTGILDIKDFQLVHLEIIQHPGSVPNLTCEVVMGKISGTTLAQSVGSFPLGPATIHTFKVVGPEMAVWVRGGPPNTAVQLQAWVFLH